MICAVITGPTIEDVKRQMATALPHTDMYEWRVDLFTFTPDFHLRETVKKPLLITTRKDWFQLAILKPEYMDFDHAFPELEAFHAQFPHIQRLCSYHNFVETPEDLDALYAEMKSKPAEHYKIAVHAQKPQDALRLLIFLQKHQPLICVSMGPFGQMSRTLTPIFGSPWTYALSEEGELSQLGLLTAKELATTYRYHALNRDTSIYGLIGDPVTHSIGHLWHNDYFCKQKINALYIKLPVPIEELSESLDLIRALPFKGLSVTMPLKQAVLSCVDSTDPDSQEIGAVNTLSLDKGHIQACNTDGAGALNALIKHGLKEGDLLVLLGRGGAARAIHHEAKKRGIHSKLLGRDEIQRELHPYQALVNCTPLEMPCVHFLPNTIVMDIRVSKEPSTWLQKAAEAGCRTLDFRKMFVEQAILQQKFWQKNKS